MTLLCFSAVTAGSQHNASADEVTMEAESDGSITDESTGHEVIEVKEAIEQCRQGNYLEAVPVLKRYAAQNDVGAAFVLAKLYQRGLGVEKSEQIAAGYLLANANFGHGPSQIALGEVREKTNPSGAIEMYKKAAAEGNPLGNVKLGNIYENGLLGKRVNLKLAFSNYQKAAEANNALGIYNLARCYDQGIGTSPNELLATRTFLKSAKQGVSMAQVKMAKRYFEGKGLQEDPVAAFGWLTKASQSGSVEAMVMLGRRYEAGDVVRQNLDLAGQLYSKAAKRGDPTGKFYLALLYANGKGTKQDVVRAYVLLRQSAQSLPMAQEALDKLEPKLSDEQKNEAKKQIAESRKAG